MMNFLSRCRAGTTLTLACLLLSTSAGAQEANTNAQVPTTQPPAAVAQSPADPGATPAPVAAPTPTPAPAPAAAATETPAVPQPAGAAAPVPAEPGAQPAVPATATAATAEPVAAESTPAAPTEAAPAEPATIPGASVLPQSVQDALAPMLVRDPNLPHDLSPIGMFLAADWVVKAVMIGLAIASVITWTVLIVKVLELLGASQRAQAGIRRVEDAASLPAALAASKDRRDPVSRMVRAAAGEYDRSVAALDQAGDAGVKERVESHLNRIEAMAGRRMSRGTGVLATIGSTAPFVGLFGTVWGIMNSFIGISEAQTTNLAVVAPGIAEALLATAIGLIAAIPAVVIYNVFARAITGYRLRLADAAAGIRRLISRDLDFRGSAPAVGE